MSVYCYNIVPDGFMSPILYDSSMNTKYLFSCLKMIWFKFENEARPFQCNTVGLRVLKCDIDQEIYHIKALSIIYSPYL